MRPHLAVAACTLALLSAGCFGGDVDDPGPDGDGPAQTMTLTSSAFEPGGEIPTRHSCDDANLSPPLGFLDVPVSADTLALIMDDPDAPSGTVLHWTFWNVPADVTELEEDVDIAALGGREGQTYRGPCPPDGEHRYFFFAFAVEGELDLEAGASVEELRAALAGTTVQDAELFGTYCRPQLPAAGCLLSG